MKSWRFQFHFAGDVPFWKSIFAVAEAGADHTILGRLRSLLAGFDKAGQWQNSIAHAVQFPGAWWVRSLGIH